jgi:hypothetical protein
VLAAALVTPAHAVDFTFVPSQPIRIGTLGTLFKIPILLTNNEPTAQQFTIRKVDQFPAGWNASICVNDLCYAPFVNETVETIEAGATDTVSAWIQSMTTQGSGGATLSCEPYVEENFGSEVISHPLTAITTGIDVLIVDDDGGAALETFYRDALPGGTISGTWLRSSQAPTAADLATFPRVIWLTGANAPGLEASDRSALATYLGGNGKLLISGQNLAFDLCDATSPNFSTSACQWIRSTLNANYLLDNGASSSLPGNAADPISTGLTLTISQASPDAVSPAPGAVHLFSYGATTNRAAIRSPLGYPKVVYLAFGFEGITDAPTRSTLMSRIFTFFNASTTGVEPPADFFPAGAILAPARPNPFTPSTQLAIRVPEAGDVSLVVYDVSGRAVRTLIDGALPAGDARVAWDGRDGRGEPLPSGTYFARLTAGNRSETQKLSLVR